jgi:maleate cis-trans isomerase
MSQKNFSGSWRGVVGVIKPTYRPGSLEEFIRLLPEGIGVIPKFVGVSEGLEKEFIDGFAAAEKMIAELAEMKVDLIHPEGAPLFVQKGYVRSEEIVRELEEKYCIPVVTTGMVLVEAARALGIKKLLVISSYDDGNSSGRLAKYFSYFSDAGFQVPTVEGFPVGFADIGSVSPYEAYAFARKLYCKYPESDGLCLIRGGAFWMWFRSWSRIFRFEWSAPSRPGFGRYKRDCTSGSRSGVAGFCLRLCHRPKDDTT